MKSTNNNKEGGSNQTKVGLLIILGLISFLSLNQNHLKGYLIQESTTVSYTPLITSLYNNTKSSSAADDGDSDNVRSALLSDKSNDIDEEDEVGFWSLDSSLDEEFRFWFGNQQQQKKKKDGEEVSDSKDEDDVRTSNIKQTTTKQQKQQRSTTISKDELPIYLLQSSSSDDNMSSQAYAQMSWGKLAQVWNRTTQYEHLLDVAIPISSLPMPKSTSTAETERRVRPIIMIHCGPKTGSTTLRKACKFNLQHTCNIPHNTAGHYPVGYMDESKLYPLIRNCTNTYHFCAKEVTIPIDIPSFNNNDDDNVMFIHMFPFRQYNEWAQSALKQQYDARGTNGCIKTKSLLEACNHNRMEIDFRKYSKTELSHFKSNVVERMNRLNEQHVFIVYHHRELNSVLERLSDVYDIPKLPGSDGKGKEKRPEGTCEESDKLLDMYHDCFSDELMKLA